MTDEVDKEEMAARQKEVEEIQAVRERDKELSDLEHDIKLERGQIPPDPEVVEVDEKALAKAEKERAKQAEEDQA